MPEDFELFVAPSDAPPAPDDEAALRAAAAEHLRTDPRSFAAVRALRSSFDARPRRRGWRIAVRAWHEGETVPPLPATSPRPFPAPPADAPHVAIVGSGPAGLFAALDLLAGGVRVTVIERGRDVRTRRRPIRALNRGEPADPDCNYCFGEGGAGTYSDGKLYTRTGRKRDVRAVLEALVAHGAPLDILVAGRPHIGSNRLPSVVAAIRETILRSGGTVRFGLRAEELETTGDARARITGVLARDLDEDRVERIPCDAVVLATGHSALDAVRMAQRAGARLEPKGFAMGVRIEHPQPWLDAQQYRGIRQPERLPAAHYEVTTQAAGRGVYSFCMCPGGFIVPATVAPERVVVNGMSLSRRDSPFANSGLVVSIEPEDWCGERGAGQGWSELLARAGDAAALPAEPADDPLFGVRLQEALETLAARAGGGRNRAPAQRADEFARGSNASNVLATSYRPGLTPCDLRDVLPPALHGRIRDALRDFDRKLPGYASAKGQLVGVETRTSSPVRIVRDKLTTESPEVAGLYPAGEGAGYAGGIVSAALDGRRVAAALVTALAGRATGSTRPTESGSG